jgi:hypothetical protein
MLSVKGTNLYAGEAAPKSVPDGLYTGLSVSNFPSRWILRGRRVRIWGDWTPRRGRWREAGSVIRGTLGLEGRGTGGTEISLLKTGKRGSIRRDRKAMERGSY